jgi:TRAP-type transport system small permease protein
LRKNSLNNSRRIVTSISRHLGLWPRWLAAVALVALMFMTGLDVCMRYFFKAPIYGIYELTEYFMVVLVFFSITYAAILGSHVEITMVMDRVPKKTQAVVAIITNILCLALWVLICWQSVDNAFYLAAKGQESVGLKIPAWPFYIVTAIGSAFLLPWFVANVLDNLAEVLPE